MIIGFILNILGMFGEFASPWCIGKVIDAITVEDWDGVTTLTIWWMVFNTVSSILFHKLIGWIIFRWCTEVHLPNYN